MLLSSTVLGSEAGVSAAVAAAVQLQTCCWWLECEEEVAACACGGIVVRWWLLLASLHWKTRGAGVTSAASLYVPADDVAASAAYMLVVCGGDEVVAVAN